jgi:outer membrane protein
MNRQFVFVSALFAGILPAAALAQDAPALPSAPDAPSASATSGPAMPALPPAPAPQAYPAKIALIAFEQAVVATSEGEQALKAVQKKYEPKKTQLDTLNSKIDSLKKELQSAPATLTAEERAAKTKAIDTNDKQLQRETDDAQTAYQADLQEAYGKVAQNVSAALKEYVAKNGYTILLDVGSQQSPVIWTAPEPNADITEAFVASYNATFKAAPPAPDAPPPPAAARPKAPAPATHTAAPKPPAAKPPTQ